MSLDHQLGEAWNNLGFVRAEHDQPQEAMATYQHALVLL